MIFEARNLSAAALAVAVTVAMGAGATRPALAQSSGGKYRVERVVIAGGGGALTGGKFQLAGTIGQSQATTSSAGRFAVFSGFWAPVGDFSPDALFTDDFESRP